MVSTDWKTYLEDFLFSYLLAAWEAGCWKLKCTVEFAICLTLILKSAQTRCGWYKSNFISLRLFGQNFEFSHHSVLFLAEKLRCFSRFFFTVKVFIGSPIFLLFVCQLFTKLTSEITKQTVFIKTRNACR